MNHIFYDFFLLFRCHPPRFYKVMIKQRTYLFSSSFIPFPNQFFQPVSYILPTFYLSNLCPLFHFSFSSISPPALPVLLISESFLCYFHQAKNHTPSGKLYPIACISDQ